MSVIDTISIINETYEKAYQKHGVFYLFKSAKLAFTNGFCYEFFTILNSFFPNAILMMQNDGMHCAALIDNVIYDASGVRDDYNNFHVASGSDVEYIYKNYGFLPIEIRDELNKQKILNNLNKSSSYVKKRCKKTKL